MVSHHHKRSQKSKMSKQTKWPYQDPMYTSGYKKKKRTHAQPTQPTLPMQSTTKIEPLGLGCIFCRDVWCCTQKLDIYILERERLSIRNIIGLLCMLVQKTPIRSGYSWPVPTKVTCQQRPVDPDEHQEAKPSICFEASFSFLNSALSKVVLLSGSFKQLHCWTGSIYSLNHSWKQDQ
jgi:hypothetical protein